MRLFNIEETYREDLYKNTKEIGYEACNCRGH